MAAAQAAADHMDLGAEAHEQRPAERLLVHDLEVVAGRYAALGQVSAASSGSWSETRVKRPRAPVSSVSSVGAGVLDQLEVLCRYRVTVRSRVGFPSFSAISSSSSSEMWCSRNLGLVVDAVPRNPQRLRQIELEQPVVAQDLQGDPPALARSTRRPPLGHVLDQVEPLQLLDHGGRGRSRHAEPLGQRIVRNRAPASVCNAYIAFA